MESPDVSLEDFLKPAQILENAEKIQAFVEEGRTVQEALSVPSQVIEVKYAFCHRLLKDGAYGDAANIMIYLVVLNPFDPRFWISLGLGSSLSDDESMGIDCFAIASLIDDKDPLAHLLAALSYLSLGEAQNAQVALDLAKGRAGGSSWLDNIGALESAMADGAVDASGRKIVLDSLKFMSSLPASAKYYQTEDQKKVYQEIQESLEQLEVHKLPSRTLYFCERLRKDHKSNIVGFSLSFLGKIAEGNQQKSF